MKILMPLFAHAHTKAIITVIIPEEVESKGGKSVTRQCRRILYNDKSPIIEEDF